MNSLIRDRCAADAPRPTGATLTAQMSIALMANQNIDFKDPLWITAWLDTALKKEQEKYKKYPVLPDFVPGHEVAQAWGYVVAGYLLVEMSFKALLYLRCKQVPTKHSLTILFDLLEADDRRTLCEFYTDYRETIGGRVGAFPFKKLNDFLANLDGAPNKQGNDHIGSFDWRYFLIEEKRSRKMPTVSVEFLHEIVYGCIFIVKHAHNDSFKPSQYTHSWRMHHKRIKKYTDWLMVRKNSEGWVKLGDRLEILWGPDYRERHDLILFKGQGVKLCFADLPKGFSLPIVDKRQEIKSFDVDKGMQSIGVTRILHQFDD